MTIVSLPSLSRRDGWVAVTWRLSGQGPLAGRELFFSVPEAYADLLSERSDAAMLALLVPCMRQGADLRVEGAVSPRLLGQLNGPVQPMLRRVMPRLRPIRVLASETCAEPERPPRARLTGFSGGGDSLYTVFRDRQPDDPAPTHLVNANVGGHGEGDAADGVFRLRLDRLAAASRRLGLPLVPLDSNLRRFHDRETNFLATVVTRTAAAMLALQSGTAGFEFSNAYHRSRQGVEVEGDISRIEDDLLPLLSTESLAMRATGSDRTRVEKMLLVTAHPAAAEILDVCQEPRHARGWTNCGRCLKCQRALIFLEITGRLPRFGKVFDLRRHRRLRWWAHAYFLHGSPDMRREVEALAAEHHYAFSPLGRAISKPGLFQVGKLAQRLIARLP